MGVGDGCIDRRRQALAVRGDSPDAGTPHSAAPRSAGHEEATRSLLRTIEGEIIPRLMLAHAAGPAGTSSNTRQPTRADIDRLCELALGNDAQAALRFVRGLIADGLSLEAAYLDLLARRAPRRRGLGR
jgi:hypothetical protein